MNPLRSMSNPQRVVFSAGIGLCAAWLFAHRTDLLAPDQNGFIRCTLSTVMAALILIRPKPETRHAVAGHRPLIAAAILGAMAVVGGIILDVGQLEWLGLLAVLWACLRWCMPARATNDIRCALLLIYFAHPMPAQIFGPLQLWMQHLSVRGSEWLLLALDARAWADGLVLRTGFSVYEVPAWCSGMRTSTTVFILSLGLAILNRFRWRACLVVLPLALLQALILNIIRISTMVLFVPRLANRSNINYLHDTASWIVLLAVALVYTEILVWRRWQRKIAERATHDDVTHTRPTGKGLSGRIHLLIWASLLAVVVLSLGTYRNRPSRRAAVLREITQSAYDAEQYEEALYLARIVEINEGGDIEPEWKLMMLRLLLMLQRFDELLEQVGPLSNATDSTSREKQVLKGYALMALEHLDEADEIITDLPDAIKERNPRVAMILAQLAYEHDDAKAVARYIRVAAHWSPNLNRISLLYPYLRSRHEWQAIVDTDKLTEYTHPTIAFSVAEAYMHLNEPYSVGEMTKTAASTWPDDLRVLEPLYYMSIRRPDSEWEVRFATHLHSAIRASDNIDAIFLLFEKCFQLARPDLAWALYYRIRELDPAHPTLAMSQVFHGGDWFTFRRRFLSFSAPNAFDTIDMRPFFWISKTLRTWRWHGEHVPNGDALAGRGAVTFRRENLNAAINTFSERRERNALSLPMRYLFVQALDIQNTSDAWKTELDLIADDHPSEVDRVQITFSEIYERRMDWQNVYETLRGYDTRDVPQLNALLRLARAQRELRLTLAALFTAEKAHRAYPRSALAKSAYAEILFLNNMPEQAAFELQKQNTRRARAHEHLYARALFQTERYRAMQAFCKSALLPSPLVDETLRQRHVLPPAELSLIWNYAFLPPESSFAKNAQVLAFHRKNAISPYLKAMITLWLDCYEQNAEGDSANMSAWEGCGRDPHEKAVALNQLTLLLCRAERLEDAARAATRASELFPTSAALWRWTISLNSIQDARLAEARRLCPDDPELWLADLSLAVRDKDAERLRECVLEGTRPRSPFHPEALTRACELMYRYTYHAHANALAGVAVTRANGLLPAYVQGLRCSLFARDREGAIANAEAALRTAVRPPGSLYQKLVELKSVEGVSTDNGMVEALKRLRQLDPDNVLWAEMLGYVRYKRGGWETVEAITQFADALKIGSTNRMTYVLGAETSQLMSNHERACDILENAVRRFPDDLELKNNLAYALSYVPERINQATNYVDALMAYAPANTNFLDTAATVYVRVGNTNAARHALQRLKAIVTEGSPAWLRSQSLEAQMLAGAGHYEQAIDLLKESLSRSRVRDATEADMIAFRRYLDQWGYALREQAEDRSLDEQEAILTVGPPVKNPN
ncbi:MAG: archaeosortase/exosortase family protein [Kiritimatiellae bacterium]|nr:archaeosortase/exosortase family protein [Kiritimatiellia bacterium]